MAGELIEGHRQWMTNAAESTAAWLLVLCIVLAGASLIFGLLSWIRIKKWRQLQNYAFLQFILISAVFITTYFFTWIILDQRNEASEHWLKLLFYMMLHWQIVIALMLYLEIVDFFNVNITYRYLTANLFAWVLPFLEVIFEFYFPNYTLYVGKATAVVALVANSVLYLCVFCHLVKVVKLSKGSCEEMFRSVLVATLVCVTCGVTMLAPFLDVLTSSPHRGSITEGDFIATYALNTIAVNVFFILMKGHRELWTEHRENSSHSNSETYI